jgi:hypothetical protein
MTVPEQHQLGIARSTLMMSDVGAMIMGGMTKPEARRCIFRLTGKHGDEESRMAEIGREMAESPDRA